MDILPLGHAHVVEPLGQRTAPKPTHWPPCWDPHDTDISHPKVCASLLSLTLSSFRSPLSQPQVAYLSYLPGECRPASVQATPSTSLASSRLQPSFLQWGLNPSLRETAARQASLSITNSWSLLKPMSIELVMPSNHLIFCRPLLLPSIFPNIRVFSNESVLRIRWPKYWSFSFNIRPPIEHPGLIFFRMDWLDIP